MEVYLRPITREDTDLIVKWRNDEDVRRHFFYREPFTARGHEKWLSEQVEAGHVAQYIAVERSEDGRERPIGSTFVKNIDSPDGIGEYGVFIDEADARGKGYGKQILTMTLEHCWKEFAMKKVLARVMTDNPASLHSKLKIGFTIEEEIKDVRCSDGEKTDMYLLSILNPDF